MKNLLFTLLLLCSHAWAVPPIDCSKAPGPTCFVMAPNANASDYGFASTGGQIATDMAAYPDSTTITTALSNMPSNLNALTWAFAFGTCGSETWYGGVSASTFAANNVTPFVNAKKYYIVSTGGQGNVFNCASGPALVSMIQTYNSAYFLGFDFDLEGGAGTGGTITGTVSGNVFTYSSGSATMAAGCVLYPGNTSVIVPLGTELMTLTSGIGTAGSTFTLNTSSTSSGTYFGSCPTAYTQAQITSLVQSVQYAQTLYPNLRFAFNVGTYGGSSSWLSLSPYGIYVYNAMRTYPLKSYLFDIQALDPLNDSAHCIQKPDLSGCEMGLTIVNSAMNVHNYYGVPYNQIELNFMYGQNDQAYNFDTTYLSDMCEIAFYATALPLGGLHPWQFNRDRDCPLGTSYSDVCNSYGMAGTQGFTKTLLYNMGY